MTETEVDRLLDQRDELQAAVNRLTLELETIRTAISSQHPRPDGSVLLPWPMVQAVSATSDTQKPPDELQQPSGG